MKLPIKAAIALLILGVTAPVYAQSCSQMTLGVSGPGTGTLNGFVPFPAANAWNTNIANAPLDPDSATITSAAGFAGLHLHPNFGSASSDGGIPYIVVDSTVTPSVPINVLDYASESDVVVAPYPTGDTVPIEGDAADCSGWPDTYQTDAHALVLDRAKCWLYETYNTNRCIGLWDASSETIWDMTNNESRPWGWTSADAAGLPVFPGLVRYDEVASGAINHAIRFTMQQTKNDANNGYFVTPASHAAGTNWGVSNVMGMRIRLKASFDISGYSKVNQVILTAMKQYGMILADNGGYFYVQGATDPRWDDSDLANLDLVDSSNFDVVQATPEFPGYDAGTAPTGAVPTINSFTPSATTVASGSPVTFTYSVSGDSYDFIDTIGPVTAGSGSVTVYPTATQTYTLNSTNAYGRSTSDAITVTVSGSVAASPSFSPAGGTYSSAQSVSLSDGTTGATIYYTTNGSTPTASSTQYTGAITVSSSETIKAIAVASGYTNSAVASAAYTISQSVAATPAFSVSSGTYSSAQTVSLTDATSGATIYYTTNGTTPTASSTKYTGAITVSSSETIEAIAVASGYTNSAVASATYIINLTAAATPSFSPAGGTYSSAQTVSLTDATSGATIYYTTNGSTPTASSTKYTGAITVAATETIKAIAVASGYTNSAVASATYTINLTAAATPVFSPASGTYSSAQSVTMRDGTSGATIYYTTNGATPTASSTKYTGAIKMAATETIKAIAVASGYTNSAVASATYTINLTAAATPSFSPAGGTYSSAQSVTLRDGTSGATIYYTTNGATPTASSTKYTGAIKVAATETIKAIAVASGYTNSAVASATYTINLTAQSFSVVVSPASLTVQAGKSGTATTTVTPQSGFTSAVSLSCSGLPSGASCSFAPASVTPSGAAASTTLTVTTTTASAALPHGGQPLFPVTALGAVLCCFGWKKRRCLPVLLLAVSLIGLGLVNGCSSNFSIGGSSASPSSTSTITVLAKSGSQQSSTSFSLTVN